MTCRTFRKSTACKNRLSNGHRARCLLLIAEGSDEDTDVCHAGDLSQVLG